MTKTFQVDEAGLPSDNLDDTGFANDWLDTNRNENDFKPIISQLGPKTTSRRKVYAVLAQVADARDGGSITRPG